MLKNHYNVDENETVSSFLKEVKDKKNSNYIILDTQPTMYVNIRDIALKSHDMKEKLKTLKKHLPKIEETDKEAMVDFLINSGEQVVKVNEDYLDYVEALKFIQEKDFKFLDTRLDEDPKKQIYALNEDDKLSQARHLLIEHKINLLPVINESMEVVGEIRTIDLLVSNIYDREISKEYYNSERNHKTLLNTPITNLMNKNPLTLDSSQKVRDALKVMVEKKIPSLIVKREGKIYSVITYKDIFKYYNKVKQSDKNYSVEIIGTKELFEDEKALIRRFTEKTAKKIASRTPYNEIKLVFKTHGKEQSGHMKKGSITVNAYSGNKVITAQKEISPGTSDEEVNDKQKEDWNIPKLAQDALKTLEESVYKATKE